MRTHHKGAQTQGGAAERKFLLFDGPGGAMGIVFLFWRRDLFFARKSANFVWGVFCVFGGVFALFGGDFAFVGDDSAFSGVFSRYAAIISRGARFFSLSPFPPRGAVSKT